jgi:hypothetical protein
MSSEGLVPKSLSEKVRSLKDFTNLSLQDFNILLANLLDSKGKVADERWVEELSRGFRTGLDGKGENAIIKRESKEGSHYFSVVNLEAFFEKIDDFIKSKDAAIDLDRGGH